MSSDGEPPPQETARAVNSESRFGACGLGLLLFNIRVFMTSDPTDRRSDRRLSA
jgi:hypothetical protein